MLHQPVNPSSTKPWLGFSMLGHSQQTKSWSSPRKLPAPAVTISPLAWLKLNWFCQRQSNEIGGFGITREDDLLHIDHFVTVKQEVTSSSVHFDKNSVADHFDDCYDAGIMPNRCGRIWIHTHPGSGVNPSWEDEDTFHVSFSDGDFAVMMILGRGGETYARLKMREPAVALEIPVIVDWKAFTVTQFPDVRDWVQEYERNIAQRTYTATVYRSHNPLVANDNWRYNQFRTPLPYEGYGPASERFEETGSPFDPQDSLYPGEAEKPGDGPTELIESDTNPGEYIAVTKREYDAIMAHRQAASDFTPDADDGDIRPVLIDDDDDEIFPVEMKDGTTVYLTYEDMLDMDDNEWRQVAAIPDRVHQRMDEDIAMEALEDEARDEAWMERLDRMNEIDQSRTKETP